MVNIILGNSLEVMKTMSPGLVDLIFTDPPYARKYLYIWEPLGKEANRLLVQGGSLITLSGIIALPQVIQALSKNLNYYWCCAMFHTEVALVGGRNIYNAWKPVLWYTRGEYMQHTPISDGISPFRAQKSDHRWQQAENWAEHFIGTLVRPGGLVLDPFIGTGTTAVVCKKLGIHCIGIDLDPKQVETTKRRLGI